MTETLREALAYLGGLSDGDARPQGAAGGAAAWQPAFPAEGSGPARALAELGSLARASGLRSAGPRYLHYVVGGVTPAALAGHWLAGAFDQVASSWTGSPAAARLEEVTLDWLRELLALPVEWTGVLVSGAHQANLTCLTAAREWWAREHGVNAAEDGLTGLPAMPVLASGYVHASVEKALAQIGVGRRSLRRFGGGRTTQNAGPMDLAALAAELDRDPERPVVVVLSAGEVNGGAFDPIEETLQLVQGRRVWVHVDGAFGLCTRVSPGRRPLTSGIERAHSAAVDAHKWLNVPTGCGVAWVHDKRMLAAAHRLRGNYLPAGAEPRTVFANLGPEMSRPARAFALWACLAAYGRSGVLRWVERHLELARELARRIAASDAFELLAPQVSNVVCFRLRPRGRRGSELDGLNAGLLRHFQREGRFELGSTRWRGLVAVRVAFANWRTGGAELDELWVALERGALQVLAEQESGDSAGNP